MSMTIESPVAIGLADTEAARAAVRRERVNFMVTGGEFEGDLELERLEELFAGKNGQVEWVVGLPVSVGQAGEEGLVIRTTSSPMSLDGEDRAFILVPLFILAHRLGSHSCTVVPIAAVRPVGLQGRRWWHNPHTHSDPVGACRPAS